MDDFYLDETGLAAYFEMQWLDKLRANGVHEPLESQSKTVPDRFILTSHAPYVANLIAQTLKAHHISPNSLLEIGPSLGRNCYELIEQCPSLSEVTVVEPSARLLEQFKRILIDGTECQFSYIKSLHQLGQLPFVTKHLAEACQHIDFTIINAPFTSHITSHQFDLTVCLNVLDQCESPNDIVNALMQATAPKGVLVLSCTYQWNKKHLADLNAGVDDINDYFDQQWIKLAEDEVEYKIRLNERCSYLFLSHVVIYQKSA